MEKPLAAVAIDYIMSSDNSVMAFRSVQMADQFRLTPVVTSGKPEPLSFSSRGYG